MEKILITGCAGFIGMHLTQSLLESDFEVVGIDNLNDYYCPKLKEKRLGKIEAYSNFKFYKGCISDRTLLNKIFRSAKPKKVVNLAAQAGVRYSIENPYAYIQSNIVGFINILEECRYGRVEGLIYASSSSVYGGNKVIPFKESQNVDKPISIYAATKKSNELMAYTYSHLYGLNTTGLRFFTVYGPWGRPDMAMYIFAKKIMKNEKIEIFNYGKMNRDFTYIDDVIHGTRSAMNKNHKCKIFNLGNNNSESLMDMIRLIEKSIGKKAKSDYKEIQPGDVKNTFADISLAKKYLNYKPKTTIKDGIPKFVKWFRSYHDV
tara:strand:+ start:233 stop:1189 length:957 start_codon:yes stop_codon:yes gene_type:complete